MPDRVHRLFSIPPKCAVSPVVGYVRGKSATHVAGVFCGGTQNFLRQHFRTRGYFVSTVETKRLFTNTSDTRSTKTTTPLVNGANHSHLARFTLRTPQLCRGNVTCAGGDDPVRRTWQASACMIAAFRDYDALCNCESSCLSVQQ